MAIKKSELYSKLWQSCDQLRGGMDASQYKDYVLVMLYIKYVSDVYAGQPFAVITVPEGASFKDMAALKGTSDIGDQINKRIIEPLAKANGLTGMPDFNDAAKLGEGKAMVERLTNLIAIFEDPKLDFSKNRADGDDLLGDAYEYLMRHFATESGKSKGQFYTPAEVSRIIAKVIGIGPDIVTAQTTVYDPTCGSGSLLLKVAHEAERNISLFGQEKDVSTIALARMNLTLHGYASNDKNMVQGNTLATPRFTDKNGSLKQFDYVVANPPFSDKAWSTGITPDKDPYARFELGIPPTKNGDFAYLLHILRSLKRTGQGACILPHGVLFRGNAEAAIRKNLIQKGYIRGIIGLPANLFYGTGIPACILVLDKRDAAQRKAIFMVDAGKGYIKDGAKNRLREQDLHKIVDVFNKALEIPGYSRIVPYTEIADNDFNLNIPRYIDSQEAEDIQDIEAHLKGGLPERDIDALGAYWKVYPGLQADLFEGFGRPGYLKLKVRSGEVRNAIFDHAEFRAYAAQLETVFADWRSRTEAALKALKKDCRPKRVIHAISEDLLQAYADRDLVNKYDVYQHLMNYWAETMQDDLYIVSADGWVAKTERIIVEDKKGKQRDKGWTCDLLPKMLVIDRYFLTEKTELEALESKKEQVQAEIAAMEETHGGEFGLFAELDVVNKAHATARLKAIRKEKRESEKAKSTGKKVEKETGRLSEVRHVAEEQAAYGEPPMTEEQALAAYVKLHGDVTALSKAIKVAAAALDAQAYAKYPELSEAEVKVLVVDDKWLTQVESAVRGEMDRISQRLAVRIGALAERYATALPELQAEVEMLEAKVLGHLETMGIV